MRFFLFNILLLSNFAFSQEGNPPLFNSNMTSFKVGDEFRLGLFRTNFCCGHYSNCDSLVNDSIYQDLVNFLSLNAHVIVELETHTDLRGSSAANLKLSQTRVENVKKQLVLRGIASNQIKATTGFGESKPIYSNEEINKFKVSDKAKFERMHHTNRRTIIRIVEIKQ